jgi:hypothetical protein
MSDPQCTAACWTPVRCATCGKTKAPIGRSVPLDSYLCDSDCPGWRALPFPPHLWPSEAPGKEDSE